jgi:Ca2+-binding RTX toxin-like protein
MKVMKRILLLMAATMTLALIVAGGVAFAATMISCPGGGADCFGTDNDDRIKGSDSDEKVYAQGGNDTVDGNGGWDVLLGDDPEATDSSLDGNDKLDGGPGDDGLHGYGGSDTLIGGSGNDIINSEFRETPQAQNTIKAGSGDDEVRAVNGVRDSVDCGTGSEIVGDRAQVDTGLDKVARNCEHVTYL